MLPNASKDIAWISKMTDLMDKGACVQPEFDPWRPWWKEQTPKSCFLSSTSMHTHNNHNNDK